MHSGMHWCLTSGKGISNMRKSMEDENFYVCKETQFSYNLGVTFSINSAQSTCNTTLKIPVANAQAFIVQFLLSEGNLTSSIL